RPSFARPPSPRFAGRRDSPPLGPGDALEQVERLRQKPALLSVELSRHRVDDPGLAHAAAGLESRPARLGQGDDHLPAVAGVDRTRHPAALLQGLDALAHRLLAHLFEIGQGAERHWPALLEPGERRGLRAARRAFAGLGLNAAIEQPHHDAQARGDFLDRAHLYSLPVYQAYCILTDGASFSK